MASAPKNSTLKHPSPTPRKSSEDIGEKQVCRSISIRMIRHSESQNNQVYRDARRIFKGGTPEFDLQGWIKYVDDRRSADPGLSAMGEVQAEKLAGYLEPHLRNQASSPVRFVVSPMKRTLLTILPTLTRLNEGSEGEACDVIINGFYHESEGCHTREEVEPGMNAEQINKILELSGVKASYVGFQNGEENGWYSHGDGPETRPESEERAAKFYLWMVEFLDQQLYEAEEQNQEDVFDAGVTLPEEEHERDHDRFGPRTRRRRTAIFVGHGDFMSLVLKRIVAGFGHAVEKESIPHRSAFVHNNTGITELEYFGNGKFLIMSSNQTPHLSGPDDGHLITGGSLKDGWSYLMPNDKFLLDAEVTIAFSDEVQPHVQEQTGALRSLYLSKGVGSNSFIADMNHLDVTDAADRDASNELTVVVNRGLQVVGCASLDEKTGRLSDVVVRPSARRSQAAESLIEAVKSHARQSQKVEKIVVQPKTDEGRAFFKKMGFEFVNDVGQYSEDGTCENIRMECKL
mmetsp:Transcript_26349/g.53708  ORF Transcript_26349/g.53708 Transcript_26349/m.53708 type:complete len:516 (-) Transcript_26349:125-1672(-)